MVNKTATGKIEHARDPIKIVAIQMGKRGGEARAPALEDVIARIDAEALAPQPCGPNQKRQKAV